MSGLYLSALLYRNELAYDEKFVGLVIAAVIFFGLGVRLLVKAVRNERVLERREDGFDIRQFLRMTVVTSFYSLFAGLAFGFLGADVCRMLGLGVLLTIAFVIFGMYTGYHFGFEHRTKAYIGGAILLCFAGIDVIMQYII